MKARPYTQNDYELLASWWAGWGLPISPPDFLSSVGFIVEGEEPLVAGFLYRLGDSSLYWAEGIVSNPEVKTPERKEALTMLIDKIGEEAKRLGARFLMASTPREGLGNMFQGMGFSPAPEKYTHYGRLV